MKLQVIISLLALSGLALAQDDNPPKPIPSSPAVFDQKIIDTAMKEIGVTKQVGYESDRVREYVETTDQEFDEYYQDGWCNAFVSWVLKQNGYQFASLNTYDEVDHFFKEVDVPKVGDVVILTGHIAFYGGETQFPGIDNAILLLGGNQAHKVCIFPISKSKVKKFLEPVKAPTGWMPSRHISQFEMASFNRLDDKGYVMEELEKTARIIGN
jgi:uncharacterized protein (TIGR02594 family)